MKKFLLVVVFLFGFKVVFSQNVWANPSYKPGDLLIYCGSGAITRHLEPNYFNSAYKSYRTGPFTGAGVDYCFTSTSSALWGIGVFASASKGTKQQANETRRFWREGLIALKLTHHHAFFVRKKLDMYTGYLLGVRSKRYQATYENGKLTNTPSGSDLKLAFGMSGTVRYSPYPHFSVFAEAAMGYQLQMLQIGVSKTIRLKTITKERK